LGVTPGQLRYARAGLHHRIHSPGSRDVKGYQPAFSEVVPAGRAKTVEISAFLCSERCARDLPLRLLSSSSVFSPRLPAVDARVSVAGGRRPAHHKSRRQWRQVDFQPADRWEEMRGTGHLSHSEGQRRHTVALDRSAAADLPVWEEKEGKRVTKSGKLRGRELRKGTKCPNETRLNGLQRHILGHGK
jgi:hypothetical protein